MSAPNILLLMADQLTARALSVYGNKVTKTPNIDKLAANSVIFDSAYTNSPLCAPSRYVFMSGRLPSEIGAYDNAAEMPSEVLTFGHYMRHAGYNTILSGKMHFCGADQLHGFEERLTTDIYPADFGWTPDWQNFDSRKSWYHNMTSVTDAGVCVRTNQLDFDDEVVFQAQRKLYDIVRGKDKRPFCMLVSMTHPHDPYAISKKYWDLYRHDDIDMPRVNMPADQLDPHNKRIRHVCNMQKANITDEHVRNARHAYYGAVSYVDENVGRMLTTLEETGLADNTIIVVLADHGDMLGERGMWYKMSYFEGSCRVPLMIHSPKNFKPHRVSSSVSLMDLLPTLAELGNDGKAPQYPEPIDGRSLVPHLQGTGGHDEVIGEYLGEGAIAPVVMIRRGNYKFIHSPVDPDQLFDVSADPDERQNLAESTDKAELVSEFRREIAARWELNELREKVIVSQQRRLFHFETESKGKFRSWDHQPFNDASRAYMRNSIDLDDLEAMARFPRVVSHE